MTLLGEDRDTIIADLRRKLGEAEDTIAAIRKGEVDALVVSGDDSDEIFTIEGDAGYREFMEAMDPGAIAVDASGAVLYANSKMTSLFHQPLQTIQGTSLASSFDGESAARLEALLSSATSSRQTDSFRFPGQDDVIRHFDVSATPLRMGAVFGHALTFVDVTERTRAEAAEQSERAARAVIASTNEAVLVCDRNGLITHANAAARVVSDEDLIGRRFTDAVPLTFSGATGLMQGEDIVALALEGNAFQGLEAVAPNAAKVKDFLVSVAPLRVAAEQISGCVIAMVDLSQRKALEKQQLLLMAELDHRVKNTLALVQSISSRTYSTEDTLEGYHKAFSGRIQALAATHNLLADRSWADLRLNEILRSELNPYVGSSEQLSAANLGITVAPRAAIALGLIFHELATNAVKYGALSSSSGTVTVEAIDRADSSDPLIVEWREAGGPEVKPSQRKGFGSTVIMRSLQYSPQGKAELLMDPTGLVCRIFIPADDVH